MAAEDTGNDRAAEALSLAQARVLAEKKTLDYLEKISKINSQGKAILQKNLDIKHQELEVLSLEVGEIEKARAAIAKGADYDKQLIKLKELGLDLEQQTLEEKIAQLNTTTTQLAQQKQANAAASTLLKRTTGVSDAWKGTVTGILAANVGTKQFHKSLFLLLNPADILMSTFEKIKEISLIAAAEYDGMAASLRKIAGAGSGVGKDVYATHRQLLAYGITITEAGQAHEALYREMAMFSQTTKENQKILREQAALLNEVGASFDVTSEMVNILDKGLGMSVSQIKDYTATLYDMSEQLKVPPDLIFKDWQVASKELMKYGDGMDEVLYGLEKQAKNTGLAMGDLLGIAKQFDQFDTAGEAVGRLNAILGGPYLNAIDMVYMKEDERVQALRDSIALSGRVFSDLGRHEQQAIATAAGITDMSVAARLFGGTQKEFEDASANQEALRLRAQEAQKAMDQMKQAMMGLAIAVAPIVELFAGFATGLANLMTSGEGAAGGLMSLAAAIIFVGGAIFSYTSMIKLKNQAQAVSNLVDILQLKLEGEKVAAKGLDAAATHTQTQAEIGNRLFTEKSNLSRMGSKVANEKDALSKVGNAGATDALALSESVETGIQKKSMFMRLRAWLPTTGLAVANWTLAASFMAVGAAIGGAVLAGYAMYQWVKKMSPVGKTIAVILGIMAIAAAAFAIAASAGTAAFPIVAGLGVVGIAGGLGAVAAGTGFDEGGNVGGKKGKAQSAIVHGGETVLPTHKKSDDQAVADAEAKGQLSLTKNKGQEQLIGAINNLVSKLDIMMTKSEERGKSPGKEKTMEVTLELDRDKVGQAAVSWIDEVYGWLT